MCPYCGSKGLKDEGCEHVTCANCLNDYCYTCGCKRKPTLQHENSYHRPSCTFYDKEYIALGNVDEMKPDCDECQKLGAVCKRPVDLYKGLFPPELLADYDYKADEEE